MHINPSDSRYPEPNPYRSPDPKDFGRTPAPLPGPGFTLMKLLGVVGIIAIVIAFLLPLQRSAREPTRRSGCSNNLKQISLALRNYVQAHGALPPAYTVDANGQPLHSWRTLILPYMEEHALHKSIDLTKPWDHPVNAKACQMGLPVYQCPSFVSGMDNRTIYMAVLTPSSCFQATRPRKLADVSDDLLKTLTVIEVDIDHAAPWMAPIDAGENLVLSIGSGSKLAHPGEVQAAFLAGNVGTVRVDMPMGERRAMISIAGGD